MSEENEYDHLMEQARDLATEHGRNWASWVFSGHDKHDDCANLVTMLDDGDPEVYDRYRAPDLSGEYAGDYTPADLASYLGLGNAPDTARTDQLVDDACDVYLETASDAFWSTIETEARACVDWYAKNPD